MNDGMYVYNLNLRVIQRIRIGGEMGRKTAMIEWGRASRRWW